MQIPSADFRKLYMAIDILEAQERLASIDDSLYPVIKDSARKQYREKLRKKSYPQYLYPRGISAKPKSSKDIAAAIQRALNV